MWVKFFAQSAVLSHPISSGIPVFSDFFVQNIRAKKRSVTSGDSSPIGRAIGKPDNDELDAGSITWHERVGLAYGDRRIYTMRFCLAAVARDSRALPFLK